MILIDTNVYVALENGVTSALEVLKTDTTIGIPIMVVAELSYGFSNGSKKDVNEDKLNRFLSQDFVEMVFMLTATTAKVYAELALYARIRGRALSNNDIWIAAIAKENDFKLATYDKDFEVFLEIFGKKLLILTR